MGILRLSHIGICVSDLESALAFYRDALGFRELSRLDVSGAAADTLLELQGTQLHAVYLERDAVRIELLWFEEPGHRGEGNPRPMNQLGLTHLSFRVEDLEAVLASIERAGGRVLEPTRIDNPEFQARVAFATDPDGTRIELVQIPGDPDALPGS